MTNKHNDNPLAVMEQAAQAVAALTGIKQQLIDAGWDERNAEQAVIAMLSAQVGKS